ncbi:hypothetical protein P3T40_008628, partial [Paraburkholderia sp. EB58]|uniref:hypothetical protein n=1 Tax=Paraburkholderia sp. EB58 TaxID=3035125 RepID=UPI003D1DD6F4
MKYGALAHIKSQLNPGKLFSLFAQVFRTDSDIAFLHGAPFPLTPEIMFRQPRLIAAASLGNELVWAISTCIHFADRLSRFNLRRDAFEKNASFKFSMGGLAGQVRAPARRSEYLTRVEKAS